MQKSSGFGCFYGTDYLLFFETINYLTLMALQASTNLRLALVQKV